MLVQREAGSMAFRIMGCIGCLNIFMSLTGMALLVTGVSNFVRKSSPDTSSMQFLAEAFYFRTFLTFIVLILMAVSGVGLWRCNKRAITLTYCLFIFQIIYWVGGSWLGHLLAMSTRGMAQSLGQSLGATAGIGSLGLTPQLISGYPVWGLVLLVVGKRKLPAGLTGPEH